MATIESSQQQKIIIRTEADLQKYAKVFDFNEKEVRELRAGLLYGTVHIVDYRDQNHTVPATYWDALEKLAKDAGMTTGEYLFDMLAREVEGKAKHVTPIDDDSRKYFRDSWQDFNSAGRGQTWAWDTEGTSYELEIDSRAIGQGGQTA